MEVSADKFRASVGRRRRQEARYRQVSESVDGLQIESVQVHPSTVIPGGLVTVTVVIKETAEIVLPGDPDLCPPVGPAGTGLRGEVTVTPDWMQGTTRTTCVPVFGVLSPGRREIHFTFQAPDGSQNAEEHAIGVELYLPGSDSGPVSVDRSVTVAPSDEGGTSGCRTDPDCPTGSICEAGECVSTGGGGGGGPVGAIRRLFAQLSQDLGQTQQLLLIVLIVLIASRALG